MSLTRMGITKAHHSVYAKPLWVLESHRTAHKQEIPMAANIVNNQQRHQKAVQAIDTRKTQI